MSEWGLWLMDSLFPIAFTVLAISAAICFVVWSLSAYKVYKLKKRMYSDNAAILESIRVELVILKSNNRQTQQINNILSTLTDKIDEQHEEIKTLSFYFTRLEGKDKERDQ